MVGDPLAEDMIDAFPARKIGGQITPRTAALGQVEYGVNDAPPKI